VVQAEVGLKAGEEPGLQAQGTVSLTRRPAPGGRGAWFSPASRFTVAAHLQRNDSLVLDGFTLEAERISFHLSGSVDSAWKQCQGRFTLACTDLSPLGKMTGSRFGGNLRAEGDVTGPLLRPQVSLRLASCWCGGAGFRLEGLEGDFILAFLDLLYPSFPGLRLQEGAWGGNLSSAARTCSPAGEFTWEAAAEGPVAETIRLQRLSVVGRGVSLSISWSAHHQRPAGGDGHGGGSGRSPAVLLPDRKQAFLSPVGCRPGWRATFASRWPGSSAR